MNIQFHLADSPAIVINTRSVNSMKKYEAPIIIEVQELGFIKIRGKFWELLTLIQRDGSTHPVMKLERGDINNFLAALEPYIFLKQLVPFISYVKLYGVVCF